MKYIFILHLLFLFIFCAGCKEEEEKTTPKAPTYARPEEEYSFNIKWPDGIQAQELLSYQERCRFPANALSPAISLEPARCIHGAKMVKMVCHHCQYYFFDKDYRPIYSDYLHYCDDCFLFEYAGLLWSKKVQQIEEQYQHATTEDQAIFYRKRLVKAEYYRDKYKQLYSRRYNKWKR